MSAPGPVDPPAPGAMLPGRLRSSQSRALALVGALVLALLFLFGGDGWVSSAPTPPHGWEAAHHNSPEIPPDWVSRW
jgi:hypothetical protein